MSKDKGKLNLTINHPLVCAGLKHTNKHRYCCTSKFERARNDIVAIAMVPDF